MTRCSRSRATDSAHATLGRRRNTGTWWRRNWELVVAISVLGAANAVYLGFAFAAADGHLIYGLDDPYIHMATAKNLVAHGTWGVTRYGFTSSQSSLLWPLLLALMYLPAGPFEAAPLILNLLFATALVAYLVVALKRFGLPGALVVFIALELIVLMPVPLIALSGVEHLLQALVGLVFVDLTVRMLAGDHPPRGGARWLMALAPVVTLVRFEGVFLIAVVAALMLIRRRWRLAVALPLLAAAPIAIYAAISIAHGAFWLPNSVLLKNNALHLSRFPSGLVQLERSAIVCLIVPGMLLYALRWRRGVRGWEAGQLSLLIVTGVCLLQTVIANLVARYEAHLMPLGLYALGLSLYAIARESPGRSPTAPTWLPVGALVALLVLPGGRHQLYMLDISHRGAQNIYQQQYQMSRFVGRYYNHSTVAANDIGMIGYFGDSRIFDLEGLANNDIARACVRRNCDRACIRRLAQRSGVKVVIAYPAWWWERLPEEWRMVGAWTIPDNVACGAATVGFWAVTAEDLPVLRQQLIDFAPQLPPGVTWQVVEPDGSPAAPQL